MALIIEDGSQVANSDSYVSRAEYIAYAATLGVTIADAAAADVELIKAAEFIGEHDANMQGYRVARDQSMAFPRVGVVIDQWYWNSNEIPRNLILCQMAFALDINAGYDLYNREANPNLIEKKTRIEGAVAVEFAVKDGGQQKATRTSKGDALLASLLNRNGLRSVSLTRV